MTIRRSANRLWVEGRLKSAALPEQANGEIESKIRIFSDQGEGEAQAAGIINIIVAISEVEVFLRTDPEKSKELDDFSYLACSSPLPENEEELKDQKKKLSEMIADIVAGKAPICPPEAKRDYVSA